MDNAVFLVELHWYAATGIGKKEFMKILFGGNAMNTPRSFVVCIDNREYPASLEQFKIYSVIPDAMAEKHQQIRVIDESGEDYLYPKNYFMPIQISKELEQIILQAA
jgi:hypothetical protein